MQDVDPRPGIGLKRESRLGGVKDFVYGLGFKPVILNLK